MSIGVGHGKKGQVQGRYLPTWEWGDIHYQGWFALNKFPTRDYALMETVLMPVCRNPSFLLTKKEILDMMEYALTVESREDYAKKKVFTREEIEAEYMRITSPPAVALDTEM